MGSTGWTVAIALVGLASSGCTTTVWRAAFRPPEQYSQLDASAPFVKCHTADGAVYVLSSWKVDVEAEEITGRGILYNPDRLRMAERRFTVPFAEVALLETNRPEAVLRDHFVVLAVTTGASLLVTALCAANPKMCFGSCPTFYASDGEKDVLQIGRASCRERV